jgi:hypothetical protein
MSTPAIFSTTPTIDQHRERKSCHHYCYPSNLSKCCACEDLRPVTADGYECYVDGLGYTTTGARDDGYCPICNTKNYDKFMKRVQKEMEIKRLEDEEKNRLETEQAATAETDRAKNSDTTSGRVEYSNGDVYIGQLSNGNPDGKGRMDYADNDNNILFYEGQWTHGKHHGHGYKQWMDNVRYEGEWSNGMMHGEGIYHMNEVDILNGRFDEDEFCG